MVYEPEELDGMVHYPTRSLREKSKATTLVEQQATDAKHHRQGLGVCHHYPRGGYPNLVERLEDQVLDGRSSHNTKRLKDWIS